MSGSTDCGGRLGRVGACVLLVALAIACDDGLTPDLGQIEVTVTTTGADLDPDGYSLAIDGAAGLVIPVNTTKTVTRLSSGSHSVLLAGLAANCTVSGDNPRLVDTGHGLTAQVAFAVSCVAITGSVAVMVATTGVELDPDGYMVRVDGGPGEYAPLNAATTVSGLKAGNHTVLLAGLAPNCVPGATNPRSVDVVAGQTVQVAFVVSCAATTGTLRVTTTTAGIDLDPDGYTVALDGAGGQAVPVNGAVVFSKVLGGSRTVTLSGLSSNCAVGGANPRSVTVTVGDTTAVAFAVQCAKADRIAFVTTGYGNADIYVMLADGSSAAQLTNNPAADLSPSWSPDGMRLAFVSYRDRFGEIYVMNGDGTSQVRVTSVFADNWDPAWSPDGTRIAFVSNRDGNAEIYLMNADGSGVTRLTNDPGFDAQPVWSPDGTKIAFQSSRDGNYEIYVMNADGSGLVRVTNNPATDADPAWSPDGSKIAFTSDRDGNSQIYVMNPDGSGVTRLTNDVDYDLQPAWSPNGSTIAFAKVVSSCDYYCYDYTYVYTMKTDGSGLLQLQGTNTGADSKPAWKR